MGCNCKDKTYRIDMGSHNCCPSRKFYYTKGEIDEMLEDIESGSCCITEEEVDAKIESAMTEIEEEIPSLEGYATEDWVEGKGYITGVDLSNYATLADIPDLSNYALRSDIPTSNTAFTNDAGYLTEHQTLKTINNQSLIGEGNITIEGGGTAITVDDSLDSTSENPVENRVITNALNDKANASDLADVATSGDYDDLINKPTIPTVPTNVSEFYNDANYVTESSVTTNIENHFWCGTQAAYDALATKQNNVLYLIHE